MGRPRSQLADRLVTDLATRHGLGRVDAVAIAKTTLELVRADLLAAGEVLGQADPDLSLVARTLALRLLYTSERLHPLS